MKLASFIYQGLERFGVVVDGGIVDLGRRMPGVPTLMNALASGRIDVPAAEAKGAVADYRLDQIEWLSPITRPEKIICVGRNYRNHVAEVNAAKPDYPTPHAKPMLYVRMKESLVPHEQPLVRPFISDQFDFEGELAVVIGKGGRHIPVESADSHIAGYTCFQDGSIRDFQFEHSLSSGKNFVGTGGIGPWIVTPDEAGTPREMRLVTRINGAEVQKGAVADLIHEVPALISYISMFMRLDPGDIISTGTPEGVGFARKPPIWLKPGDVVEVEISGVGLLRNPVIDERQPA